MDAAINLLAYIKMRGDLTFRQSPFNAVDAAVCALLVGVDLEGMPEGQPLVSEVAAWRREKEPAIAVEEWTNNKDALLQAVGKCQRFEKVRMTDFVRDIDAEEEKTFYAITFLLPGHRRVIAYRGTDGTFLSWKENFNTLYQMPTYGQMEAAKYLKSAAGGFFDKCILVGHSKGANLACYAGIYSEPSIQKKILQIYSFDGPGFMEDISSESGYQTMKDRIRAYIPEESLIGRLMVVPYDLQPVKSTAKGIYQHDLFSWCAGPLDFEHILAPNEYSDNITQKVNDWIFHIPAPERREAVDQLFKMFSDNGIDHVDKLLQMNLKTLMGLVKSLTGLSPENRKLLFIILKELR